MHFSVCKIFDMWKQDSMDWFFWPRNLYSKASVKAVSDESQINNESFSLKWKLLFDDEEFWKLKTMTTITKISWAKKVQNGPS